MQGLSTRVLSRLVQRSGLGFIVLCSCSYAICSSVEFVIWHLYSGFMAESLRVIAHSAAFVDVLAGKPTRFSNGESAPQFPDMVTGFSYFIVVAFGLSALLVLGLRVYERYQKRRAAA